MRNTGAEGSSPELPNTYAWANPKTGDSAGTEQWRYQAYVYHWAKKTT